MRRRTSLTLLEVLIAMMLMGGLLWVLVQGLAQMQKASRSVETRSHLILETERRRVWIQRHLAQLLMPTEGPCLAWDGARLHAFCNRGAHPDPHLSGPVHLELSVRDGHLVATMRSDPALWGDELGFEEQLVWPHVQSLSLRAFGTPEEAGREDQTTPPSWQEGPQTWSRCPLYLVVTIEEEGGRHPIPIIVDRDEPNDP